MILLFGINATLSGAHEVTRLTTSDNSRILPPPESQLTKPPNKDKLSLLRIITEKALRDWSTTHARAKRSLVSWVAVVRAARWESFAAVRRTFASADQVVVRSGRAVLVFNIAGNQFRLICAVHFNTGLLFALRFMTHAEYSKDRWKDEL